MCPGWVSSQQVGWSRGRDDTSSSHPASTHLLSRLNYLHACSSNTFLWPKRVDDSTYRLLWKIIIWILLKSELIHRKFCRRERTNYFIDDVFLIENKWNYSNTHHLISLDDGREQPESEHCCCSWLSDMGYITGRRSNCTKCWCWRGWYNNKIHFTDKTAEI